MEVHRLSSGGARLWNAWAQKLQREGLAAPFHVGSVSQQGIEPASPAVQGGFLTTGPSGKSQKYENFKLNIKQNGKHDTLPQESQFHSE